MPAEASAPSIFAPVAQRVRRRVGLRRWLAWLTRTWRPVSLLILLVGVGRVLTGAPIWGWICVVIPLLWLFVPLALAFLRLPNAYNALALWDRVAGRREAFASAWWFEQQATETPEVRAHVEAQRARLPEALPRLSVELPLSPSGGLLLPLLLAGIALLVPVWSSSGEVEIRLDATMAQAARDEAERLKQTNVAAKPLEALKEEEQKELEQLQKQLQETAQSLENAAGRDMRSVMSELERRARDAEKLAQRLGLDKNEWASEALIKSLRRQADTADLGDAVAARRAPEAAAAAERLADQLKAPDLKEEIRERLSTALSDAKQQADEQDSQRLVGQHVLQAEEQLRQSGPAQAGNELEKLADRLRDLAQREQARRELDKIAQQLRDAGSRIAGQSEAGAMQSMQAAGQSNQPGNAPQVGQTPSGAAQPLPQGLQPPGLASAPQAQSGMEMNRKGQNSPMTLLQPGQVGQPGGQGKDGEAPMLMAPVPGRSDGGKPDMLILGGAPPEGGQGQTFGMSLPGGRDPGVGRAELKSDPTTAQDSAKQAMVNAQAGAEGTSSLRAVEGGLRQERAQRDAQQTAVEFLQAEEAALDDAALPPSRREQVRRYFTELRKRFEQQP